MTNSDFVASINEAIQAADRGNTLVALLQLEDAAADSSSPLLNSYLGYCLARERRQFKQGVALCREALQREPGNSAHFLNLGRIYVEAGQKAHAIKAFRQGLKLGRNPRIVRELERLGSRKPPFFSSLSRNHPINYYLGLFLHRVGMR